VAEDQVIVDPKVVTAFTEVHISQMIRNLAIPGLRGALLLSFKERKLSWRCVIR
jgi:GxxExxY protein